MATTALAATPAAPASAPRPAPTAAPAGLWDALAAPGPLPDRAGDHDLYGWLVGSWDAEVIDHLPDGSVRSQSAEIHFGWALEGRAILDTWIAPARGDRQPAAQAPAAGNRYGSTLRWFDPKLGAWRIQWVNPVSGVVNSLVGRRVGADIVQTGADADGRLVRWAFTEIRPDSFHWLGESSEDGGRSWLLETEFLARRRGSEPSGD